MPKTTLPDPRLNRTRHECKFVVPPRNLLRVGALLDHVCAADPAFPTNVIKSLYFDTDRLDLLRQKQASEFLKRKVRIRWYVDPRSGTPGAQAYLEVKSKQGAHGDKRRRPLPVSAAEFDRDPLTAAEMLLRQADSDAQLADTLQGLLPAGVIQYQRRRYIEMSEGFRIALDSDIRASSLNRALLRERRESRPSVAVLEVKGERTRGLPSSLSMLYGWGVQKAAFSKYAACLDEEYPMEMDPR